MVDAYFQSKLCFMKTTLLSIVLIPFLSFSQNNSVHLTEYSNLSYLRNHIYNRAPIYSKSKKYDRLTYKFADVAANNIVNEFSSGTVIKWNALEIYLNKVLEEIVPIELKNDSLVHIFVKHNGTFGAEMYPSGQLFLNSGVFAEINDEATLAGLILHELAHYYLQHELKKFLKNEVIGVDWGIFGSTNKPRAIFSQQHELEADSLASVWMQKTPYFHSGLLNYYRILQRIEQHEIATIEDCWELKNSHFPPSKNRIATYEEKAIKIKQTDANLFLVSKTDFFIFKKQIKPILLEALLTNISNTNYDDCIERAFAFHLLEPENPIYSYYIMEAIRRKTYLDNIYWKQDFISYRYFDTLTLNNVRKKVPMGKHLLEFFDEKLVALNPVEIKDIKTHFYWTEKPRFITYDEAFEYFYRLSQKQNCTECVLSYAMSYNGDVEKRNEYLNEYLASIDAKYRIYAEKLLKEEFSENLSNKKLTFIADFNVLIKQGEDIIRLDNYANDNLSQINYLLDSVQLLYPNRTIRLLSDVKTIDFLDYKKLVQLKETKFKYNYNPITHLLDPSLATLFLKYNVNEIEFVSINLFEYRKTEKTVEAYKETLNTSLYSYLKERNTSKTADFILYSVKENKIEIPTFNYANIDVQFSFKQNAQSQLIKRIQFDFDRKDWLANKEDLSKN